MKENSYKQPNNTIMALDICKLAPMIPGSQGGLKGFQINALHCHYLLACVIVWEHLATSSPSLMLRVTTGWQVRSPSSLAHISTPHQCNTHKFIL